MTPLGKLDAKSYIQYIIIWGKSQVVGRSRLDIVVWTPLNQNFVKFLKVLTYPPIRHFWERRPHPLSPNPSTQPQFKFNFNLNFKSKLKYKYNSKAYLLSLVCDSPLLRLTSNALIYRL